jgi:hypothetical protein
MPQTTHEDTWITREFTRRGLTPPHCTPAALARALEHERQITIMFREHASGDPGVYGLLYRSEEEAQTYIVLYRASHSLVLRRLTVFHELAHLMFDAEASDVGHHGALRCALLSTASEARAEAFALGAMHYSFTHTVPLPRPPREGEDVSAFGRYLQKMAYWS